MYILLLYVALAILIFTLFIKNCNSKKLQILISVLLIAFLVCRFNIGPDLKAYLNTYNRVSDPIKDTLSYHMNRNFAFTLLSYICKDLFKEYRWFAFCVNIISMGLVSYTIFKHSKNYLLSILIFIGSGFLEVYYSSGIRQSLAMSVFMFAFFEFLPKKQYLKYYICSIIACLFHEAAVITLVIPILSICLNFIKENQKKVLVVSCVTTAILFGIASFVMPILAELIGYSTPLTHVLQYFVKNSFSILGIGMECVLTGLVLILYKESKTKDEFEYFQVIVSVFIFLVYIVLAKFSLFSRVCDLVQVIFIVLMPNLVMQISNKKKASVLLAIVMVLNLYLLYSDMTYKINRLNTHYDKEFTLENYPYVSVFDSANVNKYLESDAE